MANQPMEAGTFYSAHIIARPLALKSKDRIDASRNPSNGVEGFPGEAWTLGGHRLPKKPCIGREPEMANSFRIAPALGLLGSGATDHGNNDHVFLQSKKQKDDPHGLGTPLITPSIVGSNDRLTAPPAGQTHAVPAQVSVKRSAFREVIKRQKVGRQDSPSCADAPQPRPRDGREPPMEWLRNDANFSKSDMAVPKSFVPQPFYDATQHLLAMHSGMPHQHSSGIEHEKDSRSSTFNALTRRLPMDFQKQTRGYDQLKTMKSNTGLCKEAFAIQFGAFQNGAKAEQFSPLSFPWQQPLVPTSVLPLSSSVPGRHYDNWCAKCNASFRMTSDLVYHMRTQHKRASDGTREGAPNTPSTSGISADGFCGRRAEEKLKCERCGETFRERHHLTRHMTSHNSEHE